MNILAHAYLSGVSPRPTGSLGQHTGLLIGNFIGDFIKGDPASPRHKLTTAEVAGIRLHRSIDTFTDAHADVAAVRELLRPRCHKYAGVAVDVFFDHFLAVRFEPLTGESLSEFIHFFYTTLQQNRNRLPAEAARMLDAMIRYDWITNYQTSEGIDRSLTGLSRRTAFPSGLDTAILDFEHYYERVGHYFTRFWPTLVDHVQQVRSGLFAD